MCKVYFESFLYLHYIVECDTVKGIYQDSVNLNWTVLPKHEAVKIVWKTEKSEIIYSLLLWQFAWDWLVWQGGKVVATNSPSYRYISLWHPTSPYPIMHDIWHYLLAPWKEFFYISATWSDILPWSQKKCRIKQSLLHKVRSEWSRKGSFCRIETWKDMWLR